MSDAGPGGSETAGSRAGAVQVHLARSPTEARVLAALLEDAGIPTYIEGAALADGSAAFQTLTNPQEVRILVPGDRLAEARAVLASSKPTEQQVEEQALAAEPAEHGASPVNDSGTSTSPAAAEAPAQPAVAVGPLERNQLWLQVGIVLCIAWLPVVVTGLFDYGKLTAAPDDLARLSGRYSLETFLQAVVWRGGCVLLVLYLVRRDGQTWSSLGLVPFRWLRDTWSGILVMVAQFALTYVMFLCVGATGLYQFLHGIAPATRPSHAGLEGMEHVLFITLRLLGAFYEEIVSRGYLLLRLVGLLGSRFRAIAVSSLVFALPHIYQGAMGVFMTFFFGCLMGIVLLVGKRLWPL
ncbi:MAG TPA: CPBP family glutamic-type intramembrane protease, partial [Planctomycetota bacterium]|nr:CPBP family glutamic-type intramembrane protease [Planctomycetota bacterium]